MRLRLILLLLAAPLAFAQNSPSLFLVGDSIMKTGTGNGEHGPWGMGYELAPLFDAAQLRESLNAGGIDCSIRYSTFLPPHLFYFLKPSYGDALLSSTDRVLNSLPGIRRCAGLIIAEGTKAC